MSTYDVQVSRRAAQAIGRLPRKEVVERRGEAIDVDGGARALRAVDLLGRFETEVYRAL